MVQSGLCYWSIFMLLIFKKLIQIVPSCQNILEIKLYLLSLIFFQNSLELLDQMIFVPNYKNSKNNILEIYKRKKDNLFIKEIF